MEHQIILIVDDETDIREILQFNLENAGYQVLSAASAEEALEILPENCGLILLDVMMDGMSGFKMAEVLRKEKHSNVPIIFLTARSAENDLLTGFSAGGDDYIAKPFSVQEVLARVKAVLKRAAPKEAGDRIGTKIRAGHICIDVVKKLVFIDGEASLFSKKEFEILRYLAEHPGRVFSREELIGELWKEAPYVLDRTVDVHIARIRSKLGPYKNYVTNRSGYGYCFTAVD